MEVVDAEVLGPGEIGGFEAKVEAKRVQAVVMAEPTEATKDGSVRTLLTAIVLSDQLTKHPDLVCNFFHLLRAVCENIITSPKVPLFRKLDPGASLYRATVLPLRGAAQVLKAIGFREQEDYLLFEQKDLGILEETRTIVLEALLRIQSPAQTEPPAYIPFLRKLRTMPLPPHPKISVRDNPEIKKLIESRMQLHEVDGSAMATEILETIEKNLLMTEAQKMEQKLLQEEHQRVLEEKAKEEQERKNLEAAMEQAEELRREEEEKRLERMRADWEAAMKLQREEEAAQRKRREEARVRREREEKERFAAMSKRFKIGDEVTIFGLKSAKQYNGRPGKVAAGMRPDYRFPVTITLADGTQTTLNFKLENMKAKIYDMTEQEMTCMARLIEMGFSTDVSRKASTKAKGNLNKALELTFT